ncbi:MAG: hypothetical protein M1495_05065 [Bacteroidetes bacterium]|nr:hypothetical protein [Bacteroidota bacterium]
MVKTSEILNAVDKLSGGRINFRDDLERLIDLAASKNKMQLLEEISFNAKFSAGLLNVVQKKNSTVDEEYFIKAVEEYTQVIEKVKNLLSDLISSDSEFIQSVFAEKYFQLSQQSLSNLNLLCFDLSYLKLYFNDVKNK